MTPVNLLSAEAVADELGLHVRTIRAYIRDGRLRATRVGKQYRITRADLTTFVAGGESTGPPLPQTPPPASDTGLTAHSTVVVDIENVNPNDSHRLITLLTAAASGRRDGTPLRLTTAPDPVRSSLKVIAQGSISDTADVLALLRDITEGGNFS